eukprot:1161033-Pelagomonas_calceolata.AAC.7
MEQHQYIGAVQVLLSCWVSLFLQPSGSADCGLIIVRCGSSSQRIPHYASAANSLQAELAEHASAVRQQQQATTQLEEEAAAAKAELAAINARIAQQREEQVGHTMAIVVSVCMASVPALQGAGTRRATFVFITRAAAQQAVEGVLAELLRTEQQLKAVQREQEEVRGPAELCGCLLKERD